MPRSTIPLLVSRPVRQSYMRSVAGSGFLMLASLSLHAQTVAQSVADEPQSPASMFSSTCGVCHGADGRGGERAPNIATKREMVSMSDAQLAVILNKGVLASGMPAFSHLGEQKISQLIGYLRELQGLKQATLTPLEADTADGDKLFFAAGSCARCHMLNGKGGFLGEDLSSYARGHSVEEIRAAIVHPPDIPGSPDHLVEIQMVDGKSYRGLIRSRDNFNIVLQDEDGAYRSIARNQIQKTAIDSQPLMPLDYATKFSSKQMDNLIAYLIKTADSAPVTAKTEKEE